MSRTGDDFIEETGGYLSGESDQMFRHRLIRELEKKLVSGPLSLDEVEKIHQTICKLKGLPRDEWDYEPKD